MPPFSWLSSRIKTLFFQRLSTQLYYSVVHLAPLMITLWVAIHVSYLNTDPVSCCFSPKPPTAYLNSTIIGYLIGHSLPGSRLSPHDDYWTLTFDPRDPAAPTAVNMGPTLISIENDPEMGRERTDGETTTCCMFCGEVKYLSKGVTVSKAWPLWLFLFWVAQLMAQAVDLWQLQVHGMHFYITDLYMFICI